VVIANYGKNGDLDMMLVPYAKESVKSSLRRLNVLLRFACVDPWTLSNGALAKLLDEMYAVVVGDPRRADLQYLRPRFDHIATREALSEAQRKLNNALQVLVIKPTTRLRAVQFQLAARTVSIGTLPGQEVFGTRFQFPQHFPTLVYTAFSDLLNGKKVSDILRCSHCGNWFVPLRKPREGTSTYCSQKCAGVIASRNYRARQAAVRLKKRKLQSATVRKEA
jgi:hypothetical protein